MEREKMDQRSRCSTNDSNAETFKARAKADETKKLIEAGFEFVCSHNETMLFRKRK
jgi:hypothetical protein